MNEHNPMIFDRVFNMNAFITFISITLIHFLLTLLFHYVESNQRQRNVMVTTDQNISYQTNQVSSLHTITVPRMLPVHHQARHQQQYKHSKHLKTLKLVGVCHDIYI